MRKIELIKEQIETLSSEEFGELWAWLVEHDWALWDAQLETDAKMGKLTQLVSQAEKEYEAGKLRLL